MFPLSQILPNFAPYNGPFKVGTAEYEFASSIVSQDFESALVPTIKYRLFYPTNHHETPSQGIPWIPEPQDTYINSYLKLGRVGPWISTIFRRMSWWLKSITIPVHSDAEPSVTEIPRKVLVFSHGLVGGLNTHSAVLGELASYGLICVAIEHRDGSGPVALIREEKSLSEKSDSTSQPVYFQPIAFYVKPVVLEKRDQQLRIRLFEIMATYEALEMLNQGRSLNNLAGSAVTFPQGCFDMRPGHVIWGGHLFGGTTIIQFLKSMFYSEEIASQKTNPLVSFRPSKAILKQILPSSPTVLLDPWFMPLKSTATNFLYRKPLPCHVDVSQQTAKICTVMSSEFAWHWPENHSHMPAILSGDPSSVEVESQEVFDRLMQKYASPRAFMNASKQDEVRYKALLSNMRSVASPHLDNYVLKDTTHTTLTDLGILFPWISYYFTGQRRPQSANDNVVRCILKAAGFKAFWNQVPRNLSEADDQLEIIT